MSKNKWHYCCDDLEGECCSSCHEDAEQDYSGLGEVYLDIGDTCHVFASCCKRETPTDELKRKIINKEVAK